MDIATTTILLRVLGALLCGAILGLERERLERAAGLRTHALVAVSSCLVMIVSTYGFADVMYVSQVSLDPSRVAAQVVSGIGFLGAGVIIFRKNTVSGLTTAASIWSAAGVGLACGGGLFRAAAITMVAILLIQVVLRFFEHRFFAHHLPSTITLRVAKGVGRITEIERLVLASHLPLRGLRLRAGRAEDRIELALGNAREAAVLTLLASLSVVDGVRTVVYRGSGNRPFTNDERDSLNDAFDTGEEAEQSVA